jgi:hypothetical protein
MTEKLAHNEQFNVRRGIGIGSQEFGSLSPVETLVSRQR